MAYAQRNIGKNCTPWFYPTQDVPLLICDPWESVKFRSLMQSVPDQECNHCLPDCSGPQYSSTLSVLPFRRCDMRNLGVSSLCNLNDPTLPHPRIWGAQVIKEYTDRTRTGNNNPIPNYISKQVIH